MPNYQINDIDRKILSALVNDARKPFLEIARDCGFSSHRYFHECFLKHYLCTPGEYRKRTVPVKE